MEKPVKVFHIITRLDCGGSAENTLLTAIGLKCRGYDVTVVAGFSDNPPGSNEKKALDAGIKIIKTPLLVRNISPVKDLLATVFIYKMIRRQRYDIIHTHTSKAGILGRLAACIARSKCIIHTPHGHIFYGYFSKPLTGFFIALERLCQTWTNALITLTEKEKTDYLEKGIGPASKIYPVLSGIDLGPFLNPDSGRGPARNSLGLGETDFVAGTVARLVPVKNHAMIIEAAALLKDRLPGMRFVFIGDGELHQDLLNRICSLGMDGSFVFTGWRNDIPSLLPAFDIFIMCSRNEGMGRAFVEAQAAGLPVIGSNVCGIPEVLVQGKTGFLVEPGNPGQLADTIRMLYDERDKLGERAVECRKWAQEHFSADVMVEKIEEIYKKTGYLS